MFFEMLYNNVYRTIRKTEFFLLFSVTSGFFQLEIVETTFAHLDLEHRESVVGDVLTALYVPAQNGNSEN